MNSFRITTVKNTMLIYVHSLRFCHIHVYILTKPEFKHDNMTVPIIKPNTLIHYIHQNTAL